ncbi:MAG: EF-hand domain-containing protein [Planctomycetota bacterium]|nr:EF-hand domain-containing protein [Planctomycetota bacterium]
MAKSKEELLETFKHFDRDGNGSIDAQEFKELLYALGAVVTDEEVATGLDVLDADKNGRIDFEEFCVWWTDQ